MGHGRAPCATTTTPKATKWGRHDMWLACPHPSIQWLLAIPLPTPSSCPGHWYQTISTSHATEWPHGGNITHHPMAALGLQLRGKLASQAFGAHYTTSLKQPPIPHTKEVHSALSLPASPMPFASWCPCHPPLPLVQDKAGVQSTLALANCWGICPPSRHMPPPLLHITGSQPRCHLHKAHTHTHTWGISRAHLPHPLHLLITFLGPTPQHHKILPHTECLPLGCPPCL